MVGEQNRLQEASALASYSSFLEELFLWTPESELLVDERC